jgi:hypothetical protein
VGAHPPRLLDAGPQHRPGHRPADLLHQPPGALRQIFTRGQRYLYHIVDELERRGMPTELALLPMVESAFNPMALSSAQASGLWQFIPSTGKSYKLEQNWWVDERRDVIASTNAALDYLQTIYEMHGDWHLALASYNWGEGAVGRAVAKNRAAGLPTEYQHLNMPGETRYYVPKLQALKNIVAQPELFGITLPRSPTGPTSSPSRAGSPSIWPRRRGWPKRRSNPGPQPGLQAPGAAHQRLPVAGDPGRQGRGLPGQPAAA